MAEINRIGVVGGGAWGTALAQAAARAGRPVVLWALEPEVVDSINDYHENRRFLPGVALDPAIRATGRPMSLIPTLCCWWFLPSICMGWGGRWRRSFPPGCRR